MVSRDYTKEVGLKSNDVIVPMPYAITILAMLAIAAGWGVIVINHHKSEVKTAALNPESVQVYVRN